MQTMFAGLGNYEGFADLSGYLWFSGSFSLLIHGTLAVSY